MSKELKAVDLFCGAGGTTTGAEMSRRVRVALAVDHWQTAISTHRLNHPHVRHLCTPIDLVDPREFMGHGIDVVMASPECIFHSNARGGKPVDDQRRATAWCVPRWAEVLRPKWIVIENVREFEDWAPLGSDNKPLKSKKGEIFTAWVNSLRALNYHVEWKLLNAADFGGATKRVRLFVVCRRGPSAKPIPWPAITHAKEQWAPASSIIDWSLPCPSIFWRKRPLGDKTLKRIEVGLRRFCGANVAMPFQLQLIGRGAGRTRSLFEPFPTIVAARENHGIVQPFISTFHNGADGERRNSSVMDPLPTADTQNRHALAMPFMLQTGHTGTTGRASYVRGAGEPLPTVTTREENAIVTPFMVDTNHGESERSPGGRVHSIDSPIGTLSTKNGKSLVLPFLTEFYGTGGSRSTDEPISTVTCKHRHGLVMAELVQTMQQLGIVDVGFRMLEPHELAAAQGFPTGYQIYGSKADQVKQIGNSVHTLVSKAICEAIGEAA